MTIRIFILMLITFSIGGQRAASIADSGACPTVCNPKLEPVCGSDGKTYDSSCELKNAICKDPSIQFFKKGECEKNKKSLCNKGCPLLYEPICASNLKSYDNRCLMEVEACKLEIPLYFIHIGPCERNN